MTAPRYRETYIYATGYLIAATILVFGKYFVFFQGFCSGQSFNHVILLQPSTILWLVKGHALTLDGILDYFKNIF